MDIKVVTICGSMRFSKEMVKIAGDLERKNGWCVVQLVDLNSAILTKEEMDRITNAHWKKIDISDAIYVVNIGGYIGSSTRNEINYALKNNKEVIYHESIS